MKPCCQMHSFGIDGTHVTNNCGMTYFDIADALHAYFGICGLSLMSEPGLLPINPALNISQRAADHLKTIHLKWATENLTT